MSPDNNDDSNKIPQLSFNEKMRRTAEAHLEVFAQEQEILNDFKHQVSSLYGPNKETTHFSLASAREIADELTHRLQALAYTENIVAFPGAMKLPMGSPPSKIVARLEAELMPLAETSEGDFTDTEMKNESGPLAERMQKQPNRIAFMLEEFIRHHIDPTLISIKNSVDSQKQFIERYK